MRSGARCAEPNKVRAVKIDRVPTLLPTFRAPPMHPYELGGVRKANPGTFVGPRRGVAHAVEALEDMRKLIGGDSGSAVFHLQLGVSALDAQRDPNAPAKGELRRVRKEIEDDLFPHVAVYEGGLARRHALDVERQTGPLDRGPKRAREIHRQRGEVGCLERRFHSTCLDPSEVEQGVHELQQSKLVPVNGLKQLPSECAFGARERIPVGPSIMVSGARNS